ncbi:MAG TPA: hypothetical protein PLH98_06320 [Ruminococcus flavefaciens]|nr:hypothetical protein [Ruminococcus flavefaciens]
MKKREEMLRDLHRRMDEYESERRMKRAKVTKVAASVTPVCAAAVVGVGLWKGGVLTPHNDQLISSTVESTASDVILSADNDTSADKHSTNNKTTNNRNDESATSDAAIPRATENSESVIEGSKTDNTSVEANMPTADDKSMPASDNNANTNNESQRATEAPVVQTEAPVQQATTANDVQNGNSPFLKDDEEPPTYLNLITSYPSGEDSMAVPPIGNYGFAHSLYLAMEDYKDTANYLVIADVFSENGQVFNYDDLTAEAARLSNNGYTAAVETVNNQSGSYYFISLNVTYEQLQSFVARSDYAYALRLYNN